MLAGLLVNSAVCDGQNATRSPSTAANNTSVGSFAWTTPTNVFSSNNSYATNNNKGITQYIQASNFGFTYAPTTSITGIQLDVERSTQSPTIVTLLNSWTPGLTRTVSAGSSRMLVFLASIEHPSATRSLTSLSYGGQAMSRIVAGNANSGTSFQARLEYWALLESGIAAATSTVFTPAYSTGTATEYCDYYSSAVYAGVDQILPYTSTAIYTASGGSAGGAITASPTLATTGGGMVIVGVHCGNPPGGGFSVGSTNLAFSFSPSYTETIDTYTAYSATPGFTGSGMSTGGAHQAISSSGTVAPTFTFTGTGNRLVVIYSNLTCINEIDNSVRLVKGGTIVGSDLAYTTTPWNTVDTYTSYGGPSTLWGTTWTYTDVNASNFGAVLSATVRNGNARVDHMQITVYALSTVPIELFDFLAECKKNKNQLRWRTASEINNKAFEIERRTAMGNFEQIGTVKGNGNSTALNEYDFTDEESPPGICYYRLKQIDFDGSYKYSNVILVDKANENTEALIYPNPSPTGLFNIDIDEARNSDILIYSLDMKLVKTLSNDSKQWDFSLRELADGSYYVVFNTSTGQKLKRIEKTCR